MLLAGPNAVLALRSAAFLHGLIDELPVVVDVYRPRRRGHRIDGLHIPTSTYLPARDVITVKHIEVTTIDRTVVDTVARYPESARDVVDRALQRSLTTLDHLGACARRIRRRGRPGIPFVLEVLSETNSAVTDTRNVWEARTPAALEAVGIPTPVSNHEVHVNGHTYYLDLAWQDARTYLEFDGFDPQQQRRPFVTDRRRQNELTAAGWVPFRVTAEMLRGPADRKGAWHGQDRAFVARRDDEGARGTCVEEEKRSDGRHGPPGRVHCLSAEPLRNPHSTFRGLAETLEQR